MAYKTETRYTSPYSSPRSNFGHIGKPTGITIHHWGLDGQTHDGVVGFLCSIRPTPTSAHYVVSDGLVTCIVDPDLAAWHSGSTRGNGQTIGIECRPEMSAGDWNTVVELCADLEKVYGDLKYYPHSYWSGTSCPGRYGPKLGQLINDINALKAKRAGSKPAAVKAPAKKTSKISDLKDTQFPAEVQWAVDKGIMTLQDNGKFRPHSTVNRQDLAIILKRLDGKG